MRSPVRIGLIAACFVFSLFFCVEISAQDWQPVTPAELTSTTPAVESDADAEAIFWIVRADDSDPKLLAMKHYVRVKIYTERGREQFSQHDIEFTRRSSIKDVEARVTKPDGTVVNLKKEDVKERDVAKGEGFKIKAKSFAPPGLEIGSVLEYRYKEVYYSTGIFNISLVFQKNVPIRTISYYIKGFSGDFAMYGLPFNTNAKFQQDKNGFDRISMAAVPAFKREPHMPPADQVRPWVYTFYASESPKPADYWKRISKESYEESKEAMKVNEDVKAATAQAISGAATDDEKLRKIFDYTKNEIKNLTYSVGVTDEERKRARTIKTAGEVLKTKFAFSSDIDVLFGAMAKAAGFDARLALTGNRQEFAFDPNIPHADLNLPSSNIAVKVGSVWKFFSPANRHSSYGTLSWQEEAQKALITDPKEPIWALIPLTPAENSMEKRTGNFKLLEDGTLEGEARIEFTGHLAERHKDLNYDESVVEQEKRLKDLIRNSIMETAEIEKFTIENATDPEKPFAYTFKIRVPGYASRTGKRLFFQPNVFERSAKPEFTANTRKHDVYIDYPYSSQDEIKLELPSGFSLESPDVPAVIKDPKGIGSHQVTVGVTKDGKFLVYKRKFSFGNGGNIQFPAGSYGALKGMFEAFNRADLHQMTLRQDAAK